MLLTSAFRAALVAAVALALPAQEIQTFGGSAPRMAATRLFFAPQFQLKGMVCVQYGQPTWKAEYDGMIDKLKGKSVRLGKDFWTTFNTSIPLDVGGTAVPAGAYYLGLQCDANGGFNLAILKAEAADKAGYGPFMPDAWKIDYTAAMKKGTTDKPAELMTMDLNADEKEPTLMNFVVTWGKHTLTVPVKATLGGGGA